MSSSPINLQLTAAAAAVPFAAAATPAPTGNVSMHTALANDLSLLVFSYLDELTRRMVQRVSLLDQHFVTIVNVSEMQDPILGTAAWLCENTALLAKYPDFIQLADAFDALEKAKPQAVATGTLNVVAINQSIWEVRVKDLQTSFFRLAVKLVRKPADLALLTQFKPNGRPPFLKDMDFIFSKANDFFHKILSIGVWVSLLDAVFDKTGSVEVVKWLILDIPHTEMPWTVKKLVLKQLFKSSAEKKSPIIVEKNSPITVRLVEESFFELGTQERAEYKGKLIDLLLTHAIFYAEELLVVHDTPQLNESEILAANLTLSHILNLLDQNRCEEALQHAKDHLTHTDPETGALKFSMHCYHFLRALLERFESSHTQKRQKQHYEMQMHEEGSNDKSTQEALDAAHQEVLKNARAIALNRSAAASTATAASSSGSAGTATTIDSGSEGLKVAVADDRGALNIDLVGNKQKSQPITLLDSGLLQKMVKFILNNFANDDLKRDLLERVHQATIIPNLLQLGIQNILQSEVKSALKEVDLVNYRYYRLALLHIINGAFESALKMASHISFSKKRIQEQMVFVIALGMLNSKLLTSEYTNHFVQLVRLLPLEFKASVLVEAKRVRPDLGLILQNDFKAAGLDDYVRRNFRYQFNKQYILDLVERLIFAQNFGPEEKQKVLVLIFRPDAPLLPLGLLETEINKSQSDEKKRELKDLLAICKNYDELLKSLARHNFPLDKFIALPSFLQNGIVKKMKQSASELVRSQAESFSKAMVGTGVNEIQTADKLWSDLVVVSEDNKAVSEAYLKMLANEDHLLVGATLLRLQEHLWQSAWPSLETSQEFSGHVERTIETIIKTHFSEVGNALRLKQIEVVNYSGQ